MSHKRVTVVHPFLFAVYPIFLLYSRNVSELSILDAIRPTAVALACTALLYLLWRAVVKDSHRAGVLTTISIIMFSVYICIFESLIVGMRLGGFEVGRHRVFVPLWSAIYLALVIWIARARRDAQPVTRFANYISLALVLSSVVGIAHSTSLHRADPNAGSPLSKAEKVVDKLSLRAERPVRDIYYIILDGYARNDILRECYDYDNSAFINFLTGKGFYVGAGSQSNYRTTYLSLSSSLNFEYLQNLADSTDDIDYPFLSQCISDNRICLLLKKAGYKFIFFPSGFQTTWRNPHADSYRGSAGLNLSEFERVLIRYSMLRAYSFSVSSHRSRIRRTFDDLKLVPKDDAPTFTFVHIVCPHTPYVFDENGGVPNAPYLVNSKMSPRELGALYTGQLAYINKKAQETIDVILATSKVPPIILLQADHGPTYKGTNTGMAKDSLTEADIRHTGNKANPVDCILNAYYFPGDGPDQLYKSISPVNSFRVMLNRYFGTDLPILRDCSYNSKWRPQDVGIKQFAPVYTSHSR